MKIGKRWRVALALVLTCIAPAANAQSFPSQPIKLIVGFPPGGGVDLVGRVLARSLSEALGQPVVVDNRPGASGNVATTTLMRAPPDGYTLMLANPPQLVINPVLYSNLKFDLDRDATPVARTSAIPFFAVVHSSLPVKTLGEMITYSKAHPGEVFYGSAGSGSVGHLAVERLKQLTGADLTHVPYKGFAPAFQDLIAGRVQFMIDAALLMQPQIVAGKLRPLAVAGDRRLRDLPEVPTTTEAGVPELQVSGWQVLVGPAGVPPDVILKLQGAIEKSLAASQTVEVLAKQGVEPWFAGGSDLAAFLAKERATWSSLVRSTGARVD